MGLEWTFYKLSCLVTYLFLFCVLRTGAPNVYEDSKMRTSVVEGVWVEGVAFSAAAGAP